jgi:transposase
MMSTTAPKPATTPIPVQLSEPEFETFILPHLSMPKRGPKCKLGYHRVFNLILAAPTKFEAESRDKDANPLGVHGTWEPSLSTSHFSGAAILWVLYTGMQWKCLPVPIDTQGKPAIHYTTVYKDFAKWAQDGSLWQAFVASVRHLAAEKHLDLRVLHGDGTNTVAKKGAMVLATRATNTRKGRRSSP